MFAYKLVTLLLISAISPLFVLAQVDGAENTPEVLSEILLQDYTSSNLEIEDTPASIEGPVRIDWQILQDIKYDLKYMPELELSMYTPLFSDRVKALDGKEVIIEGYVIPMIEGLNEIALSANPYAACFFCGQAGPASVMSVFLKEDARKFKLDDIKKFRGRLKLNYDNPDEFYYLLQDARAE
ncbi:MAG: DUF3299 domain-containing protein [Bacteroidota bacterium]